MNILDTIAENKIQQAIERGELDFPEMYGKPIEITEDFSIPVEVRLLLKKLSQAKNASHEESPLLRFWKARAYRNELQAHKQITDFSAVQGLPVLYGG
jgi:hypothetical protein